MFSVGRFCAVLFLVKSLCLQSNLFASGVPNVSKFLDGSAILSEEEEIEGREDEQWQMDEQQNDGIHRQDIGQREESGRAKGFPSRRFFGVKFAEMPSAPTTTTTTTTTVGPMPPLSKRRMGQKPFEQSNYHRMEKQQQKRARAFASGRYEPPAQRPPMVPRMPSHLPNDDSSDSLASKKQPSPQLSFRSPTGQYAPLWSSAGAAFAVPPPSHFGGIAYYTPNSAYGKHNESAAAEADAYSIAADGGESTRAPVLLIGAFPPSAKVRPFLSPFSPHFPSHYSPPKPPPLSEYSSTMPTATTDQPKSSEELVNQSPPPPYLHPQHPPQPSYFPTLVSARPTPTPPAAGRFIPGRPYQPSRSVDTKLITKTMATTTKMTMNSTKAPRGDCEQTDFPPLSPQPTEGPKETVPNRAIGKARIICKENGVEFALRTLFPFNGQIFAYDKKRIAGCFNELNNERNINISFSFSECGIKNRPINTFSAAIEQFHLQIVVVFLQQNGTSNVQSFFVQCGQNRIGQENQSQVHHIEEALEELQITPIELEQKAPLPIPTIRFLKGGKENDQQQVDDDDQLQIGQSLIVEFALQPKTEAFGFLVKNCVVRNALSGAEYEIIDSFGCSTDLNIFGHFQYDTFFDVARAHWHAFKLPDQSKLSLKCRVIVCTDLSDRAEVPNGAMSNCAALPSPPFCPDLATSPFDSVLADLSSSFARRSRLRRTNSENSVAGGVFNGAVVTNWSSSATEEQQVRASLCVANESHSNWTQFWHYSEKVRFFHFRAKNLHFIRRFVMPFFVFLLFVFAGNLFWRL